MALSAQHERYLQLRRKLSDLNYTEIFNVESVELVEHLLKDLLSTTQSYKQLQERENKLDSDVRLIQSQLFPLRKENARLARENHELHVDHIQLHEESKRELENYSKNIREMTDEMTEMKLLNRAASKQLKEKDKIIDQLRDAYESITDPAMKAKSIPLGSIKISTKLTAKDNSSNLYATNQTAQASTSVPSSQPSDEKDQESQRIIQVLRSQLDTANNSIHEYKTENMKLKSSIFAREQELSRTGKFIGDAASKNSDVHLFDSYQEGIGRTTEATEVANKRIIHQLNEQVDFLNEQLAKREAQLHAISNQLNDFETLQMELSHKTSIVENLKSENSRLVDRLKASERKLLAYGTMLSSAGVPGSPLATNRSTVTTPRGNGAGNHTPRERSSHENQQQLQQQSNESLLVNEPRGNLTIPRYEPQNRDVHPSNHDDNSSSNNNNNNNSNANTILSTQESFSSTAIHNLPRQSASSKDDHNSSNTASSRYQLLYESTLQTLTENQTQLSQLSSHSHAQELLLQSKQQEISALQETHQKAVHQIAKLEQQVRDYELQLKLQLQHGETAKEQGNQEELQELQEQKQQQLEYRLRRQEILSKQEKQVMTEEMEDMKILNDQLGSEVALLRERIKILQEHISENNTRRNEEVIYDADHIENNRDDNEYDENEEEDIERARDLPPILQQQQLQQQQREYSNKSKTGAKTPNVPGNSNPGLQAYLEKQRSELIEENMTLKSISQELELHAQRMERNYEKEKKQKLHLQQEYLQLQETYNEQILQIKQYQDLIAKMENSFQLTSQKIRNYEILIQEKSDELKTLEEKLNNHEKVHKQQEREKDTIVQEKNRLLQENQNLQEKYEKLQDYYTIQEKSVQNSQNQIQQFHLILQHIEKKYNLLKDKNHALEQKKHELEITVEKYKITLQELTNKLQMKNLSEGNAAEDILLMTKENQALTMEITKIANNRDDILKKYQEIVVKVNELESVKYGLEIEKKDLMMTNRAILQEKQKLEEDIKSLSVAHGDEVYTVNSLHQSIAELQSLLQSKSHLEEHWVAEKASLSSHIEMLNDKLLQFQKRVEILEGDNRRMIQDTHGLRQTNGMLNDRLTMVMKRAAAANEANKVLTGRLTSVERERDAIRALIEVERQRAMDMAKIAETARIESATKEIHIQRLRSEVNSFSSMTAAAASLQTPSPPPDPRQYQYPPGSSRSSPPLQSNTVSSPQLPPQYASQQVEQHQQQS